MNNTYYKTLDENFEQALNYYEKEMSHEELINLLKDGNIVQKQIAALRLDTIKNSTDANVLLSNLTGQDGKIREAVSLKMKDFLSNKEFVNFFEPKKNYIIFLDAITDINGNICRNIISGLSYLVENKSFCSLFCPALCNLAFELLDVVEKFDFQDGKYKVNKEAFKLYWCLETIFVFAQKIDLQTLKKIILRAKNIGEYTIREKVAKILTIPFNDKDLINVKNELKNDCNYFVRRFL